MSDMIEIWKPVVGYEGFYEVSNNGTIRGVDRYVPHRNEGMYQFIKGRIRKTKYNNGGYEMVTLQKNGKDKTHLVHRLVAQAFIPNPDNLPEVNHKDEDIKNNRLDNLEWCNRDYNLHYGTGLRRRSEKLIIPIIQFTLGGELIRKWGSMIEVQNELGINRGNISNVCSGRCKSAGGFRWEYYNTDRYLIALMIKTLKERERAA